MGSWFTKPQSLTTTQNASTQALPPFYNAYQQLLNRTSDVSNTPFNPNTNAGVAGFVAPQQQAFDVAQGNIGSYQPWIQQAGLAALAGSGPTYQTVDQYMNPYTQNVTNSLLNNYSDMIARNRQMSMSDAAKAGALTGDRRYIAQAMSEQPINQALAQNLAQTQQRGYETALGAAQTDAGRGLQAAQILGYLGGQQQQYGTNDVNTLLGIGGLQQAQQQRVLDTATQNALRQAAYPFETAQWATNQATQLGGAAGSSSAGQTVQPGPSWGQQILGAAATAGGLALGSDARIKRDIEEIGSTHDGQPIYRYRMGDSPKTQIGLIAQNVEKTHPDAVSSLGGIKMVNYKTATDDSVRGEYALGGGTPYGGGGLSYVPQIQMQPVKLQQAQFVPPTKIDNGMDKILSNFTNAYGNVRKNRKETGSWTNPDTGEVSRYYEPSNASKLGDWLGTQATNAWGGLSNIGSGISNGLGSLFGYNDGGVVRHGYYNGGLTPFDYYAPYIPDNNEDGPSLLDADPRLGSWTRQQGYVPPPSENKPTTIPLIDQNVFSPQEYFNSNKEISEPETRVIENAPIPPDSTPLTSASQTETEDNTITPQYLMRAGLGDVKPPKNANDESESTNIFGFKVSPDAANALVAAGLGMMASNSPFIGQAIGQGGMAGMNYYLNAQQLKQKRDEELRKELRQAEADKLNRLNIISQINHRQKTEADSGVPKAGLTPFYVKDAEGNTRVMQLTNKGDAIETAIPKGMTPVSPEELVGLKEQEKLKKRAEQELPKVINQTTSMLKLLSSIKNNENLDNVVGPIAGRTPSLLPGSTDVQAKINQATSKTFLQAIQAMQGSGSISNIEGSVATDAISRLRVQGVNKDDYVRAIEDLEDVIKNGEIEAKVRAGKLPLSALEQKRDFEHPVIQSEQNTKENAKSPVNEEQKQKLDKLTKKFPWLANSKSQ